MSTPQWNIRSAIPRDIPFIYETWLKSYKHDSAIGRCTRSGIFFENYRKVVDKILQDSNTDVACLPDDGDVILGYLVSEDNTLHYAFVKEAFRNIGISKSLLMRRTIDGIPLVPQNNFTITHKTFYMEQIVDKYKLEFNPYVLFKGAK